MLVGLNGSFELVETLSMLMVFNELQSTSTEVYQGFDYALKVRLVESKFLKFQLEFQKIRL